LPRFVFRRHAAIIAASLMPMPHAMLYAQSRADAALMATAVIFAAFFTLLFFRHARHARDAVAFSTYTLYGH